VLDRGGAQVLEVLLVDDSPIQLSTRESILRAEGFSVCVANTVESAMAFFSPGAAERIGVVVTDHIMPEQTGTGFVRQLRQINPTIPVIVVSGMADAEEEYTGLNVKFLQKPCFPPELIRTVRTAMAEQAGS